MPSLAPFLLSVLFDLEAGLGREVKVTDSGKPANVKRNWLVFALSGSFQGLPRTVGVLGMGSGKGTRIQRLGCRLPMLKMKPQDSAGAVSLPQNVFARARVELRQDHEHHSNRLPGPGPLRTSAIACEDIRAVSL